MSSLIVNRCTIFLVIAGVLTLAAVIIAQRKANASSAVCCFAIGWHIAIVDAVDWVADSFRQLPPYGSDIYQALVTSLLSLLVPLIALAIVCVAVLSNVTRIGRGPMFLLMSCCVALVDLILVLLVTQQFAMLLPASGPR